MYSNRQEVFAQTTLGAQQGANNALAAGGGAAAASYAGISQQRLLVAISLLDVAHVLLLLVVLYALRVRQARAFRLETFCL